ncbi:MAG: NADH:flavin oxidoreductase [Acidimicrobiia bacterium]|nr:NADH:flavin oxidoreductase [Acidimicrobiia bacterium]MBV9285730.1 NADH:flavin oxidoreductase [Acidimicrobiia bacterium]
MAILETPLQIGSARIRNRLYRAPVLEGAGSGPDAAKQYARQFVANARAGVGLIVQGNSCIYEEGRTSPGMTLVNTRERVLRLGEMVDAVHAEGGAVFLQIGHGGLYAMEAWHHPYAEERKGPLLAPSKLPLALRPAFLRAPVHPMTTDEVYAMATRFGEVSAWAREAGYDGVQLASGNAKLIHQFLTPFYNRRTDEFGGSVENRGRVLRVIREAIAEHAGEDYACTVKIPVDEKSPPLTPRISFDDGMELCRLAQEWGYHAVTPVRLSVLPDTTLTKGDIPASLWRNPTMKRRLREAAPSRVQWAVLMAGYVVGSVRNPFRPVWNRDVFTEAKRRLSIPVFAVGGIRTADEVNGILEGGEADMVGIGRPFYAEADLAARILGGSPEPRRCLNSNFCVPAEMLGMKGTCYNPKVKKTTGASS